MTPSEKIEKARISLILDHPFFGSLILGMNTHASQENETGWTNGQEIGYSEKFIDGLTQPEVLGFLAHEIMHVATLHHLRRENRNAKDWNIATDKAINDILSACSMQLPPDAIYPSQPGLSAEEYYSDSQSNPDIRRKPGDDPGGAGAVKDAPPDTNPSQEEAETKQRLSQAITAAKARGKIPGALARHIGEILNPPANWKEILREYMEQLSKNDYTWTPPNRRYVSQGSYLPSLGGVEMAEIVLAIDTSSSIDKSLLSIFCAELLEICNQFQPNIRVIFCDSDIQEIQEYSAGTYPEEITPPGGGGTDFRPVFDYQEALPAPACLIYFTDLDGAFPETPPTYPTLWIVPKGIRQSAPFGQKIEI